MANAGMRKRMGVTRTTIRRGEEPAATGYSTGKGGMAPRAGGRGGNFNTWRRDGRRGAGGGVKGGTEGEGHAPGWRLPGASAGDPSESPVGTEVKVR